MTTFLILALVFVGALYLARILILIAAAIYERVALRWRDRVHGVPRRMTLSDTIDLLTLKEWIRPPRRRPSSAAIG